MPSSSTTSPELDPSKGFLGPFALGSAGVITAAAGAVACFVALAAGTWQLDLVTYGIDQALRVTTIDPNAHLSTVSGFMGTVMVVGSLALTLGSFAVFAALIWAAIRAQLRRRTTRAWHGVRRRIPSRTRALPGPTPIQTIEPSPASTQISRGLTSGDPLAAEAPPVLLAQQPDETL